VLHTILAIGHYEDRIVIYTHGNVDIAPAWLAYELLQDLTSHGKADLIADRFWLFVSLTAAASFAVWLHQTRGTGRRTGWLASVLAMAALQGLVWLYDVVTARGGAMRGTWLDTRLVAYPLWMAATVTVVVTAVLCARVVRQNTPASSAY
jgi:hypothetical protein